MRKVPSLSGVFFLFLPFENQKSTESFQVNQRHTYVSQKKMMNKKKKKPNRYDTLYKTTERKIKATSQKWNRNHKDDMLKHFRLRMWRQKETEGPKCGSNMSRIASGKWHKTKKEKGKRKIEEKAKGKPTRPPRLLRQPTKRRNYQTPIHQMQVQMRQRIKTAP